jgi:hypothetical protein
VSRVVVVAIAFVLVVLCGLAAVFVTGGTSESGIAVEILRGHGIPADPPPLITRVCSIPLADRWSECPISSKAALAAGGKVADGTGRTAELVSIRLTRGRTMLAWAVSVVPRTPPPAPDSAATFLVVLDGHTGKLASCNDFDYGGPYPKRPPPTNPLVLVCAGAIAATA